MKRIFFTAMSCLALAGLNASAPCGNYLSNNFDSDCCRPSPTFYPEQSCAPRCGSIFDNVSIKGDFLYWDNCVDGFGVTTQISNATGNPDLVTREYYTLDFDWAPGYRVGANYSFEECKGLELFVLWTWFRTQSSINLVLPVPAFTSLTVSDTSTLSLFTNAGATPLSVEYGNRSTFKYERLDLGLLTSLYSWNNFVLRPSVAFTYVYIKETFNSLIERAVSPTTLTSAVEGTYSGYGASLGLGVLYPVSCGFGLYAESQITGLWGKLNNSNSTLIDPPTGDNSVGIAGYKYWVGRFIFSEEVGVQYSTSLMNTFSINIHAGWQIVYLPRLANYGFLINADSTINGLVVGADVGF